jgi:hypothetical protein
MFLCNQGSNLNAVDRKKYIKKIKKDRQKGEASKMMTKKLIKKVIKQTYK